MDLNGLRNEQKFTHYLHFGVGAFKKMSDGNIENFNEALRGYITDPELICLVLQIALRRRRFVTHIRDKIDGVDYNKLKLDPNFQKIKEKIVKNYPQLTNISAIDLFRGICNSIAHGEVEGAFDFNAYKEMLQQAYKVSHVKDVKNSWYSNKDAITYEKLEEMSTLQVGFRYGYMSGGKGTKIPLVYNLGISLTDITNISNLASKYFDAKHIAITAPKDGEAYEFDIESKQAKSKNLMDGIKTEAYKNITDDFLDFCNSEFIGLLAEDTKKTLKKFAEKIAITRTCLMPSIINYRLDDIEDTVKALALSKMRTHFTSNDLCNSVIKEYKTKLNKVEDVARALYCSKIENVYQELLITELLTIIERLENKNKLELLTDDISLKSISSAIYNKDEQFLTKNNLINTIKMMRNAFVHMNYIYDPYLEEFHFYSLVKQDRPVTDLDKSELEYRVTVDIETLENLTNACNKVYKLVLEKEVEMLPNCEEELITQKKEQTIIVKPFIKK